MASSVAAQCKPVCVRSRNVFSRRVTHVRALQEPPVLAKPFEADSHHLKQWAPESWRKTEALQQPNYPDQGKLQRLLTSSKLSHLWCSLVSSEHCSSDWLTPLLAKASFSSVRCAPDAHSRRAFYRIQWSRLVPCVYGLVLACLRCVRMSSSHFHRL